MGRYFHLFFYIEIKYYEQRASVKEYKLTVHELIILNNLNIAKLK